MDNSFKKVVKATAKFMTLKVENEKSVLAYEKLPKKNRINR